MDEISQFKRILAQNSDGISNKMILMPYAKNLSYDKGHLLLTMELFNDLVETEINVDIIVTEELKGLLDNMMQEKVV